MSVTIFVQFAQPVEIEQWQAFCGSRGIGFSPNTVGQNAYYSTNHVAEIVLGSEGTAPVTRDALGRWDFSGARPPENFAHLRVGTVYTERPENMALVADIALAVVEQFRDTHGARLTGADERLEPYLKIVWV